MATEMIEAAKITPNMKSWLGEAIDIFKETENGIPTGRVAITWLTEEGRIQHSVHEREEKVEIFYA